jgi:hypothetical protein
VPPQQPQPPDQYRTWASEAVGWTGPFDRADAVRQGSALDALNAAVGVTGDSH